MAYLSIAITLLSFLVKIYEQFWSDSAQLKSLQLKLASLRERQAVEAERLQATYSRIDKEVPKEGQLLVDKLNQQFPPKP